MLKMVKFSCKLTAYINLKQWIYVHVLFIHISEPQENGRPTGMDGTIDGKKVR